MGRRELENFSFFATLIIIVFVIFCTGYIVGNISFGTSDVDVQAMRMACINAGYVKLTTNNTVTNLEYGVHKSDSGVYSCNDYGIFNKENRVVLVGGKYVVQTKQPITEWK